MTTIFDKPQQVRFSLQTAANAEELQTVGFAQAVSALEVFPNQIPESVTGEQAEQNAFVFPVTAHILDDATAEKELRLQKEAKAPARRSRRKKGGRGLSRRKGQRGKRQRKHTRTPMAEARILEANVDLSAQAEGDTLTLFATAYVASGSTTGSSTGESFGDSSTDNTSQLPELAISQAFLPYTEQPAFSTFAFPVAQVPSATRPVPPPVPAIQMEYLPALPVYQFVSDAPHSLGLTTFGVLTPTDPAVISQEVFSFCNVPDMMGAPPSTHASGVDFFSAPLTTEQEAEAAEAELFLWDTLSPTALLALLPLEEEELAFGAVADQAVPMPPASPASPVVQAVPSVAARALNEPVPAPAVTSTRRTTTRSADAPRRPTVPTARTTETTKTITANAAAFTSAFGSSQATAPVRAPRYAMRSKYRCGYCGQPKLGHECQAVLQVSGTGTQTDLTITAPHRIVAILANSKAGSESTVEIKAEKSSDETTLSSESDNSNADPETEAETSDSVSDAPAPGEKSDFSKRGIEDSICTRSKRRKQAF